MTNILRLCLLGGALARAGYATVIFPLHANIGSLDGGTVVETATASPNPYGIGTYYSLSETVTAQYTFNAWGGSGNNDSFTPSLSAYGTIVDFSYNPFDAYAVASASVTLTDSNGVVTGGAGFYEPQSDYEYPSASCSGGYFGNCHVGFIYNDPEILTITLHVAMGSYDCDPTGHAGCTYLNDLRAGASYGGIGGFEQLYPGVKPATFNSVGYSLTPIEANGAPEPGTIGLALSGLCGAIAYRRRLVGATGAPPPVFVA